MVLGSARVRGAVVHGVHGLLVDVEVDISQGLPGIGIVGLPDTSVGEARQRVRCAVDSTDRDWPAQRITVSLTPAEVRKAGSGLDLPIAIGILAASGELKARPFDDCVLLGELGLDGRLVAASGVLAMAIAARDAGARRIVVPRAASGQLLRLPGVTLVAAGSLAEVVGYLEGKTDLAESTGALLASASPMPDPGSELDISDVRGHQEALLALEVAAAGRHHLALQGPPGVGKSMIAMRLSSLLPDLTDDQALDVAAIHGVAGLDAPGSRPPVACPHHSASAASLLGAVRGTRVAPGAVTIAHHGVLVLDEAPEFARPSLEGLRQPLEAGVVSLQRAGWAGRLPARFQLVMTANPCPCGKRTGRGLQCRCTSEQVRRYAARLSGPVLDRVDLRLIVVKPSPGQLRAQLAESSAAVRERVCEARARAAARFADLPWRVNAEIPPRELRRTWHPDASGAALLEEVERESEGLRGPDRILRMAWSIADLSGVDRPGRDEVAVAVALRGAWGEEPGR